MSMRFRSSFVPVAILTCAAVLQAALGCSSNDDEGDGDSQTGPDSSDSDDGSDSTDGDGSDSTDGDGTSTTGMQTDEPGGGTMFLDDPALSTDGGVTGQDTTVSDCAGVTQEPEGIPSPVDIIFVIDNSSSMDGEIRQVQDRINEDFADIIEDSGVDFRVIMVARYGDIDVEIGDSDNPICIREPLGAGDCSDPDDTTLEHNPPRFFHYSADVRSREAWCDILDGWDSPDELKLPQDDNRPWDPIVPLGWRMFLRENAFKNFVVITDDDADCQRGPYSFQDGNSIQGGAQSADAFDQALLALEPRQFGNVANRKYMWHSIVAMAEYDPPTEPWPPTAPVTTGRCEPGSEGPATGFQALSVLTGGLRYPTCNNDNFDAIFRALAEGVIQMSVLSCEWEIPQNALAELDVDRVNLKFFPGDGSEITIPGVEGENSCGNEEGWYYDDPDEPRSVVACPSTCTELKAASMGRVELEFGCERVLILR